MVILWVLAGAVLGWFTIYFQIWNVAQLGPHTTPNVALALVIGGALIRWTLVAVLFWAALQVDVVACLLSFIGLWVARWWMVCQVNAGRNFKGLG